MTYGSRKVFHQGKPSSGASGEVLSNRLLTSNLVSHSLGLDHGDVVDDPLVGVEVLGQPDWLGLRGALTFRSTSQ